MPKRPEAYHRPTSLAEAVKLLEQPGAAPMSGGTRLLADDVEASIVVDLQALGLDEIDLLENELHLGATAKLTDILESSEISGAPTDLLYTAIRRSGPNTYRNAASPGGIIAQREPDSELLALFLVMDARLTLVGSTAVPDTSLAEYLEIEEKPSGLITDVRIPWGDGAGAIERVARTPADYPIVSVAVWQPHGADMRIAATGISARPKRLEDAEVMLAAEYDLDNAQDAARQAVTHPGDFRGSTEYRRDMVAVLLRRAIESAQG